MFSRRFSLILLPLLLAAPALAQLNGSETHKFLDAIKNQKGQDVTDMLAKPGNSLINTQDPGSGDTALHIVVRRGDATYTRFLLQRGADPNIRNKQGDTPAMLAVTENEEPCLQALIAGKANVNVTNDRGETPLIRAVQLRNVGMVHDLLGGGADPDLTDHIAGLSARDYAKRDTRSPTIAKMLADAPRVHKAPQVGPSL
jgi:ankyrin repeat protein